LEFKLNGPSAVLALAALGAFTAYRLFAMQSELSTDGLELLKTSLSTEYSRSDVDAMAQKFQNGEVVAAAEAVERTDRIEGFTQIEFAEVDARGMWEGRQGGDVIVKVQIAVNGGPPPDGDAVRYYRMRYRPLTGWQLGTRTSALSYWLKLF